MILNRKVENKMNLTNWIHHHSVILSSHPVFEYMILFSHVKDILYSS